MGATQNTPPVRLTASRNGRSLVFHATAVAHSIVAPGSATNRSAPVAARYAAIPAWRDAYSPAVIAGTSAQNPLSML